MFPEPGNFTAGLGIIEDTDTTEAPCQGSRLGESVHEHRAPHAALSAAASAVNVARQLLRSF